METLTYQQLIQNILQDYVAQHPKDENIETQIVCDTQNHHYLLLYVGWEEEKQVYGCPIHVDIKDNKFWIQRDFTEIGIANQLLKAGISKEKIVLGFRSPFNRQFTDFAVV
ncbi:MAG: XisI protein [Snowella sp.]|nr:XisI protein [Snowella sp.]